MEINDFGFVAPRLELSQIESVIQKLESEIGSEPAILKEITELETENALVGEEVDQVRS